MGDRTAVVIGNRSDLHVEAVLARLAPLTRSVVFDADSLVRGRFHWDTSSTFVEGADGELVELQPGLRGWVRRLTPPFWQRGTSVESIEAAEATAKLAFLGGTIRTSGVEWLTDVDSLVVSESKMLQATAAAGLGIPYPPVIITDSVERRDTHLFPAVLKPLGPSHYFDGDSARFVAVDTVQAVDEKLNHLAAAPFLLQRAVSARAHWRIVTVMGQVWAARLDAAQLPTDWRADAEAHRSFVISDPGEAVRVGATAIAEAMSLGYSSQDWIEDDEQIWLVDVNPAGQWLFLPQGVADEVSSAIANWLEGDA